MKKSLSSSERVSTLRSQHRVKQRQTIKADLRFINEVDSLPSLTEESQVIDQQGLVRLIEDQDVEGIYECVCSVVIKDLPTLERYLQRLIRVLCSHLQMPASILTIRNLAIMLEIFGPVLFQMGAFPELAQQLTHFPYPSPSSQVYLETIGLILRHRNGVEVEQLSGLMAWMERLIYKQGAENQEQLVTVWSRLAHFSSPQFHYQDQSMLQLCQMFWKTDSLQSKGSLYQGITAIAQSRILQNERLILAAMAVVVRGRTMVKELVSKSWPVVQFVVDDMLRDWMGEWDKPIELQIDGKLSSVSVEDYLLTWEKDLLSDWEKKNCLKLWLLIIEKASPAKLEQCFGRESWLEQMVQSIPDFDPQIVPLWLKVIECLLRRAQHHKQMMVLRQQLKDNKLQENLVFLLQSDCGHRAPVPQLCQLLFWYLKQERGCL